MTELKQLRDFAEEVNGVRPTERSIKGVVNNLINNYKGGGETPHLYRYNIICTFDDANDNERRICFEILSPLNLDVDASVSYDIALNNLKQLIGGNEIYIPVSSDVYALSNLSNTNGTLFMALYLFNNEFTLMNIDADRSWSTSISRFQVIQSMSKKTQLI